MNKKLLLAFLAVLQVTTGCVIHGGGGHGNPGNVTFTWSFYGAGCTENPSVARVVITIPGETLQNGGSYPCSSNNYPGIVLHDFAPGTYNYTIDALGYSNERLFTSSGTFAVNGDVRVTIDLTPVGSPASYAYLNWRFPANSSSSNPDCVSAGVTDVEVDIDGYIQSFRCVEGKSSPGARTVLLNPGVHDIRFRAMDSSGYVYYSYAGTLTTSAGSPSFQEYTFNWAVGGAVVRWQLTSSNYSCTSAGITDIAINFRNVATQAVLWGNYDNPATWAIKPCSAGYWNFPFLPPGTYQIYIKGSGPGGGAYYSNGSVPPQTTINAGVFPPDTAAQLVVLN
jgi:hypothetical protein